MTVMKKGLIWEATKDSTTCGVSTELIAVYILTEIRPQQRRPRFYVDVLTEVGVAGFNREFRTAQAAQRFCDRDLWHWRTKSDQP